MKKVLVLILMAFVAQGSLLLGDYKNLKAHLNDSEITKKCLEVSEDWSPYNSENSLIVLICYNLNMELDRIQRAYEEIELSQLEATKDKILNYLDSKEQVALNRSTIRQIFTNDIKLTAEDAEKIEKKLYAYNNALHKVNEQAYVAAKLKLKK